MKSQSKIRSNSWSRLDNAGKLFPSITSARTTTFFRVAVLFKEPLDEDRLRNAVALTMPRFPAFRVRLVRGAFWYSLVPYEVLPPLVPETEYPCMPLKKLWKTPHLFRIRWWNRRLAVEFSHTLTDGTGALTFLTALLREYVGVAPDPAFADEGQNEDAFQQLQTPGYPRSEAWSRAAHLPFDLFPVGQYIVVTGQSPLDPCKEVARQYGLTITEFMTALLLAALQEVFQKLVQQKLCEVRPLRLVIPINLRKVFPSHTLRNFFAVFPVEIDPRLGTYSFEEICRKVQATFQIETDSRLIKKQIARNLRGEWHPLARVAPLPLKNLYLNRAFVAYEKQYTMSLSNLGSVVLPQEVLDQLEAAEFVPPPNPHTKEHCGIVSCGKALTITFARQIASPLVEREFFQHLRALGIPVRVWSNLPEEA